MSALPSAASESAVEITMGTELEFEWLHVTTQAGLPHVVRISYRHLKPNGRGIPHCPLRLRDDNGFRFSIAFMDAFAENILPCLAYVGIVYEGPVPEYVRDLPEGGQDVLASKVYWRFPVGMVRLPLCP